MKTIEQLKARAKELGKQAADYSREANQVYPTNQEMGKKLMQQAHDSSKRCQVIIKEILRRQ
jgi:hypothetical protein